MSYTIDGFITGKKTRRGVPIPPAHLTQESVLVFEDREEARSYFGCKSEEELRKHLRALRDEGVLVTAPSERHRFSCRVRSADGASWKRCLVFREQPRRYRPCGRVLLW